MAERLEILPVPGLPEVRPGDDLAVLIAAAAPWLRDGDVVVVTSKIVSKAEGRLIRTPVDSAGRERARERAIEDETAREVARRGRTRIVATRHGFVMAAAGVDASNVRRDEIALLPLDPDASARRLREALRRAAGVRVAVVVSDTMGRTWRNGLVDVAIGLAGISAIRDERGHVDAQGNELAMTEVALADEVAAAADLVKGKLAGVPVAVVRGLSGAAAAADGPGVLPLVRPAEQDLFRLGTAEAKRAAVLDRRDAQELRGEPVDVELVRRAVAAAMTAPDAGACRFLLVASVLPNVVVPCLAGSAGPATRARLLSLGAAVEALLVTLAADEIAARWDLGAPPPAELPADWSPAGAIAIGELVLPAAPAPALDLDDVLQVLA